MDVDKDKNIDKIGDKNVDEGEDENMENNEDENMDENEDENENSDRGGRGSSFLSWAAKVAIGTLRSGSDVLMGL